MNANPRKFGVTDGPRRTFFGADSPQLNFIGRRRHLRKTEDEAFSPSGVGSVLCFKGARGSGVTRLLEKLYDEIHCTYVPATRNPVAVLLLDAARVRDLDAMGFLVELRNQLVLSRLSESRRIPVDVLLAPFDTLLVTAAELASRPKPRLEQSQNLKIKKGLLKFPAKAALALVFDLVEVLSEISSLGQASMGSAADAVSSKSRKKLVKKAQKSISRLKSGPASRCLGGIIDGDITNFEDTIFRSLLDEFLRVLGELEREGEPKPFYLIVDSFDYAHSDFLAFGQNWHLRKVAEHLAGSLCDVPSVVIVGTRANFDSAAKEVFGHEKSWNVGPFKWKEVEDFLGQEPTTSLKAGTVGRKTISAAELTRLWRNSNSREPSDG